jgi:hypothetical protein
MRAKLAALHADRAKTAGQFSTSSFNMASGWRIMVCCGRDWQPTVVTRVIEQIRSSTCVVKVATDEGVGFVKGMGNPQGDESLALELVGSELAALLGLKVPPFAVIDIEGLEIEMITGSVIRFGPAFISKALPGSPSDSSGIFLKRLANPEDVALLVAFDTWVRNIDRCPPSDYLDPTPKWDNLFFTPRKRKFEMVVFDHTHCFVEGDLSGGLEGGQFVDDPRIYGAFPNFLPMLTEQDLRRACAVIARVDAAVVIEIIGSVPASWGPVSRIRDRWAEAILERGRLVEGYILSSLLPQLPMQL